MSNVSVCTVSQNVLDVLKKFKLRKQKNIAAISLKINKATLTVEVDEEFEDVEDIADLQEELPHQQPRYLALSYVHKHSDGRVSYPFIFIFITPDGCSPELQMMYAGSKLQVVKDGNFTKEIELRCMEDLTEETVKDKLKLT